jgi:hypothetical protein
MKKLHLKRDMKVGNEPNKKSCLQTEAPSYEFPFKIVDVTTEFDSGLSSFINLEYRPPQDDDKNSSESQDQENIEDGESVEIPKTHSLKKTSKTLNLQSAQKIFSKTNKNWSLIKENSRIIHPKDSNDTIVVQEVKKPRGRYSNLWNLSSPFHKKFLFIEMQDL